MASVLLYSKMLLFRSTLLTSCFCAVLTAQSAKFQQGLSFTTQPGPLASVTGDFNGDGHMDLIVANTAISTVSVFLGVGDGTFGAPIQYPAGCQIGQIITGDFNGDGRVDLLGSCTLTSNVVFLPGLENGAFGTPILSAAPLPVVSGFLDGFVQPFTAGDVNGDGIADLALIIQTSPVLGLSSPGAIGQAVIMTGNGDGTFTYASTLQIAPPGTEPYALELADLNGDGKVDIAGISFTFDANGLTTPNTAFLIVAMGDGAGGFQLTHYYPLTGIPQTGMMLADVNGDGKTDVVFAGLSIAAIINSDDADASGVGVFLGNGDGSFTPGYVVQDSQTLQNQLTVGSALSPVLGTQYPDIVAVMLFSLLSDDEAALTGEVVVRPNNGDGTFGTPITIANTSTELPFSLSIADFNGDGRPDLAVFEFSVNLLDLIFSTDITTDIDTAGQTIASFPSASIATYLNGNPSTSFTNTNAANFHAGPVATSSIASAFGAGLASSAQSASTLPLLTSLAGCSIGVTDALGVTRSAPLFYVSPTQVNYEVPDGTALGNAMFTITTPSGILELKQPIVSVAPGVFGASGLATAQVFTYTNSATPAITNTLAVNAQGQLSPVPIDVGTGSTNVYLILYGTGVRDHQTAVTATVGTTAVMAAYAGAQGTFVGEDQINLLLPQSLRGAGLIEVTLNVDGQATNPVRILIQ